MLRTITSKTLILFPVVAAAVGALWGSGLDLPSARAHVERSGRLPFRFEPLQSKRGAPQGFAARTSGAQVKVTPTGAEVTIRTATKGHRSLRMKLRGANARSKGTGLDRQPGVTNYFLGSDPRAWRRDVPNFDRVEYSGVYEGIDLVYYGKEGRLEFDFHFAPGADPRKPVLQFAGADRVQISSGGELVLDLEGTQVLFHRPEAYQGEPGDRRAVACDYDVARDGTVRFRLGSFDHSLPLVIDPEMTVFTLFGGSESDYGTSVALDPQGNIYVAGETKSADFPTVNAIQDRIGKIQNAIPTDLFIAKLDPEGKHLLSATYLGGSGTDRSARLAVDSAGRVYVAGETHSADFPRTAGSLTMGGPIGANDTGCFVARFSADMSAIDYSVLIGPGKDSYGWSEGSACSGLAADDWGHAYVAGATRAVDFATTPGAFRRTWAGNSDIFILKLNPEGSALVFSTYLGGSETDEVSDLKLDGRGHIVVAGLTWSLDFPVEQPWQSTAQPGSEEGYTAVLDPSGSRLIYSTYIGKQGFTQVTGLALDSAGNIFLCRRSSDPELAKVPDGSNMGDGYPGAFAMKLTPDGSPPRYSVLLKAWSFPYAIAVDGEGSALLVGAAAYGAATPTGALYRVTSDLVTYLAKLAPDGSDLLFSTPLSTGQTTQSQLIVPVGITGLAVDLEGAAYLIGSGYSAGATFRTSFEPIDPVVLGVRTTAGAFLSDSILLKIMPENPRPRLEVLNPSGVVMGSNSEVQIIGHGFVTGSKVLLDGVQQETTFQGAKVLTFTPQDFGKTAGVHRVSVSVPGPGGGTSNEKDLTIYNPVPMIERLFTPQFGAQPAILDVLGRDFLPGAVVRWNGEPRPTTYRNSGEVEAALTSEDTRVVGAVTIWNPGPGGGTSAPVYGVARFPSIGRPPALLSIAGTSGITHTAVVGSGGVTLTVQGGPFMPVTEAY